MKPKIKKINPVARAMLRNRRSPQVIRNKKKDYRPEIRYDDLENKSNRLRFVWIGSVYLV